MSFLFFQNPAKKNGILPLQTESAFLCQPISWSMAAMLGNSVVVVVVRTRPRAIPLAHENHEKIHSWVSFSSLYGYGAPLGGPWGRRSSAIIPLVIHICYWPAEVLKMLPEAAGRGQHFQARGHSFSLCGPTLSR